LKIPRKIKEGNREKKNGREMGEKKSGEKKGRSDAKQ